MGVHCLTRLYLRPPKLCKRVVCYQGVTRYYPIPHAVFRVKKTPSNTASYAIHTLNTLYTLNRRTLPRGCVGAYAEARGGLFPIRYGVIPYYTGCSGYTGYIIRILLYLLYSLLPLIKKYIG